MSSAAGAAGAAGAGTAGGDAGQQGEAANGNGHAGGVDLAALAEQAGRTNESLEQMHQFLQSQPWAQQQQQDDDDGFDPAAFDAAFDDDDGFDDDDSLSPDAGDDGDLAERLASATSGFVEAAVAPLAERLDEMQRSQEWRQVAEEFPDLEDRDVQRDVFEAAQALGESQGWPAEIWSSPQMIKTVYLAHQAIRIAQEEGEDSEIPAAHLEGGSGAASGGQPTNEIAQMLNARSGRHTSLPFP